MCYRTSIGTKEILVSDRSPEILLERDAGFDHGFGDNSRMFVQSLFAEIRPSMRLARNNVALAHCVSCLNNR